MSYRVHNLALKATHLPASARLVLAAMAYFSPNDQGTEIFARVEEIAKQAGLSVRQVQRIMHRLEGDRDKRQGIIVCERSAAGHRTAKYRIDLQRLTNAEVGLPEVSGCHPCDESQGCQDVTSGALRGDTLAPDGCQDVTPRGDTDVTPIEDTRESTPLRYPNNARAGQDNGLGKKEPAQPSFMLPVTGSKPGYPANFELIWQEFTRCPGFTALMGKHEAFVAYEALALGRPDDAALCGAVRRYAAELRSVNAARGPRETPHPMLSPAKWFSSGRFVQFLAEPEPSADLPKVEEHQADVPLLVLAAADRERLKRSGLSDAVIDSWFGQCEFEVGDGVLRVTVAKPFVRNWIANHYAARIERAWRPEFGDLSVTVRVATARDKAA